MMDVPESLRLALGIGRTAFLQRRPFLVYYKPTARCDMRCAICRRWQDQRPASEELPLAAVTAMLKRFRDAGTVILALWGGEPLLREDLPEILKAAKGLGLRTATCTNARLLEKRAPELAPWFDNILVSIDGDEAVHDRLRGVRGAHAAAVAGMRAVKRVPTCQVVIWASVHRENAGCVDKVAELAAELGVVVEFFPIAAVPGYNEELVLVGEPRRRTFERLRDLRRAGLPIRNPERALDVMGRGGPFRCNFARVSIQVDHDGQLHSCEEPSGAPILPWGQEEGIDLPRLYASREFRDGVDALERCNLCFMPCVVEFSGFLPQSLVGIAFDRVAVRY